jgi:hypothetical protein
VKASGVTSSRRAWNRTTSVSGLRDSSSRTHAPFVPALCLPDSVRSANFV